MSPRGQGSNTPTRPIRIDLDLWERFGAVAQPDRSTVLREFIRWYVGEPGTKAPKRPA
jgi:hypothetical protein